MSIKSTHPDYDRNIDDWRMMRNLFDGEKAVKEAGTIYLPPTPGQILDGMDPGQDGYKSYQAYRTRAVFHDFVAEAVKTYIGHMHNKEPTIELPPQMEQMRDWATVKGEGLVSLIRRINVEQLVTGRLGLLLDLDSEGRPYVSMYEAEAIRNWDDGLSTNPVASLNLVVLDESGVIRNSDFSWTRQEQYRVAVIGEIHENEKSGTYMTGVFKDEFDPSALSTPSLRGRALDKIPFIFINSGDIIPEPDSPPLLGLGRLSLVIYRGEADYRHSLFMQGQDTLVVIGGSGENVRVGAGSKIDVDHGGDAKYIGVSAAGLSEQRSALENDKRVANQKSGQLFSGGNENESGEAKRIRMTAQTSSLNQIAITAAEGLENLLRIGAEWIGVNPEGVRIIPNLDFEDPVIDPTRMRELVAGYIAGAIPASEFVRNMQDGGVFNPEKTVEEIIEELGGINPPSRDFE